MYRSMDQSIPQQSMYRPMDQSIPQTPTRGPTVGEAPNFMEPDADYSPTPWWLSPADASPAQDTITRLPTPDSDSMPHNMPMLPQEGWTQDTTDALEKWLRENGG